LKNENQNEGLATVNTVSNYERIHETTESNYQQGKNIDSLESLIKDSSLDRNNNLIMITEPKSVEP
jgi:hypothetical protein